MAVGSQLCLEEAAYCSCSRGAPGAIPSSFPALLVNSYCFLLLKPLVYWVTESGKITLLSINKKSQVDKQKNKHTNFYCYIYCYKYIFYLFYMPMYNEYFKIKNFQIKFLL